jgi:hypothetical protein
LGKAALLSPYDEDNIGYKKFTKLLEFFTLFLKETFSSPSSWIGIKDPNWLIFATNWNEKHTYFEFERSFDWIFLTIFLRVIFHFSASWIGNNNPDSYTQ